VSELSGNMSLSSQSSPKTNADGTLQSSMMVQAKTLSQPGDRILSLQERSVINAYADPLFWLVCDFDSVQFESNDNIMQKESKESMDKKKKKKNGERGEVSGCGSSVVEKKEKKKKNEKNGKVGHTVETTNKVKIAIT